MSQLVAQSVPITRVLDLVRDRKDRTTKAYFDHETALVRDIRVAGIRTPLKVLVEGEYFRLVCGQTRLNAARRVPLQEVPVTVLQGELTPSRLLVEELTDNNMTAGFDILGQAEIFLELERENGWTHAELCANVPAAKPAAVTKAMTIFERLIDELKAKLRAGEIGPRLGYALARVDKDCQLAVYERVQNLCVVGAEELIGELLSGKATKKSKRCRVKDGDALLEFSTSATWEFVKALATKLLKAASQGEKSPIPPALVLQNLLKG